MPTPSSTLPIPGFAPLDPGRVLRLVYVGRLAFAVAIFVAALTRWLDAPQTQTLFASVSLVLAMGVTAMSVVWSEIWDRPLTRGFLYAQTLFDLALVSAIVAATGGPSSPFAAMYVLVIAVAALWLPVGSSLLVALLGCALYVLVAFVFLETRLEGAVLLQTAVFGFVAIGSGFVAERLRRAGAGTERLVEELVLVRLQAADVLRALDSGVVTVDAGGRLLYANPAASRLLAMPLESRVGRPVMADLAARAPALADALTRTAQQGVRALRADAVVSVRERSFPIGVTTTVVGDEDIGRSATAIFADISDQQRVEQLRAAAQRLEGVAELSASLAHEIRNPLAAIRSAVEQLGRRVSAEGDERALANLIVRESDRLSRLLGEFLDFARVRPAQFAEVELRELVRHVADVVGRHPERRETTSIRVDVPDAPCVADIDSDLLTRALLNLMLNAVQAMPDGGQLSIRLLDGQSQQSRDAARLGPDVVTIEVRDTGPGLAPEVRERLFQPFITTKSGGHGLGLPVTHRAVDAHHGIIGVDTGPDGTLFTITLPRQQRGT